MLVLSRKEDQYICIGDHIRVRVSRIRGNSVKLAIEAPPEVAIRRGELPPHPVVPGSLDVAGYSRATALTLALPV